jgi:hypothetical protein
MSDWLVQAGSEWLRVARFGCKEPSPANLFSAPRRSLSRVLLGAHAPLPPLTYLTICSSSFFPVPPLHPLTHLFGYSLPLLYPSTDAAPAVATLSGALSITSSPNWRAFRRNALICFSFIWASYSC